MKIVNLLTLCFLVACADKQTTANHPENVLTEVAAPTNEKIKRKITADHDYKPGDKCVGGISLYNEQGQMTEEYDYGSCDTLFKKVIYTYDETGKVISSVIESDLEYVNYNWIYNNKGELIEKVATKPTASFQYKLTFSYDSLGNQVEYKGTMADGGAFHGTSRKTFTYKNGNKLRTVCYSGDNFDIPGYRIEHVYNKEGKEIRNYVYKDPNTNKADTVYVYYEYY